MVWKWWFIRELAIVTQRLQYCRGRIWVLFLCLEFNEDITCGWGASILLQQYAAGKMGGRNWKQLGARPIYWFLLQFWTRIHIQTQIDCSAYRNLYVSWRAKYRLLYSMDIMIKWWSVCSCLWILSSQKYIMIWIIIIIIIFFFKTPCVQSVCKN